MKTTLDKQIEESKALVAEERATKDKHETELKAIDFKKQFLIRDKLAEVMVLMNELGFSEIKDERGKTILSKCETDIAGLTAMK